MAGFDYILEYKPGRGNVVADALRRKTDLAAISSVCSEFQGAIKDGMQSDPEAKKILQLAAQGQTKRFWVDDGFLITTCWRVYVPKFGFIRRRIIKERHDIPWAGHQGQKRTRALVEAFYFWPRMREEIEQLCRLVLYANKTR